MASEDIGKMPGLKGLSEVLTAEKVVELGDPLDLGKYQFTLKEPFPDFLTEISTALRTLNLNNKDKKGAVIGIVDFAEDNNLLPLPHELIPGNYFLSLGGDLTSLAYIEDDQDQRFVIRDINKVSEKANKGKELRDGALTMEWHLDGKYMFGNVELLGEHPGELVTGVVQQINGIFLSRLTASRLIRQEQ
jgi:hypothetical protein